MLHKENKDIKKHNTGRVRHMTDTRELAVCRRVCKIAKSGH